MIGYSVDYVVHLAHMYCEGKHFGHNTRRLNELHSFCRELEDIVIESTNDVNLWMKSNRPCLQIIFCDFRGDERAKFAIRNMGSTIFAGHLTMRCRFEDV